jgi:hypothetical protein
LRQRRAQGHERQQLKWFTYAVALVIAALLISTGVSGSADYALYGTPLIPLAVGIAILKYRLYAIDAIINRTLVYTALSALLGLGYAVSVFLLQQLLSPMTEGSSLAVAGSTLAVAVLFRPGRARVQRIIDRALYRHKYNAQTIVETFAARIRNDVALDTLTEELVEVVRDTLRPADVSLWLRDPKGGVAGASYGRTHTGTARRPGR